MSRSRCLSLVIMLAVMCSIGPSTTTASVCDQQITDEAKVFGDRQAEVQSAVDKLTAAGAQKYRPFWTPRNWSIIGGATLSTTFARDVIIPLSKRPPIARRNSSNGDVKYQIHVGFQQVQQEFYRSVVLSWCRFFS